MRYISNRSIIRISLDRLQFTSITLSQQFLFLLRVTCCMSWNPSETFFSAKMRAEHALLTGRPLVKRRGPYIENLPWHQHLIDSGIFLIQVWPMHFLKKIMLHRLNTVLLTKAWHLSPNANQIFINRSI